MKLPPTSAITDVTSPLRPLVNALPISYPLIACTPVLNANYTNRFFNTSKNEWLARLIPKGTANTFTNESSVMLVAAAMTVSMENNDFNAASILPVNAKGTINLEHINEVDALIAIAAIDALATPAADTKAGPSTFAPKYAIIIVMAMASGPPIDDYSHDVNHCFG